MKGIVFGFVAVLLGLLLCSLGQATYQIAFGIPPRLLLANAIGRFYVQGGYQAVWAEALFCICSLASCLVFGKKIKALWIPAPVFLAAAGWFAVRVFHMTPYPLARLGGEPGWLEYDLYGLALVTLHLLAGLSVARIWIALWTDDPSTESTSGASSTRSPTRIRAFTLVEILIVIAIVLVLAGITMPIIARAKRSARYVGDLNALRQVYSSICLYENDNDRLSPPSLATLAQVGLQQDLLRSPTDSRSGLKMSQWPANVWVTAPDQDGANAALTTPGMISFAYLKPFENRFPKGTTFETYRDNPNVGLLLDPAVGECHAPGYTDDGSCVFPDSGQPAVNIDSWLVIRTDGSATRVQIPPPPCHDGGYSYEQMFLFWPICGGANGVAGS